MTLRPRLAMVAALLLLAVACDDVETSSGAAGAGGKDGLAGGAGGQRETAPVLLDVEDGSLTADEAMLILRNVDGVVATIAASDVHLGTVGELDEKHSYDPFEPYAKSALFREPDDLAALTGVRFETPRREQDALQTVVVFSDGTRAPLSLRREGRGAIEARLSLPTTAGARPIVHVGLDVHGSTTEGFYGLGEAFDDVNNRGKVRPMQLEIDSSIESSYNEAHVPVPFVIGTSGWGLFVQSRRLGVFDVATEVPDRVRATFARAYAPETEPFVFHLFVAARPIDLVRPYYAVTGTPRSPAPWGLGPWIWRDEAKDEAEILDDLETIRDLDLATTGYWIDRPYATAVNSFDFEAARFPDVAKMFSTADALGFRTALWHTPYLDEKDPAVSQLVAEAQAAGYYPPISGPSLNKWGRPLDFSNPAARLFWQGLLRRYTDLGVRGFKLDYGEDIVAGLGTGRLPWSFADGSDERTGQQSFTLGYHQTYAELFAPGESFLLCRGGKWGDQTNVDVVWPGDLDATFALHRETATDSDGKTYTSVGGLPASVVAGLSLGASGFPFFGSDTGGYRHSPPDKELFVRWFEQTALSAVMQVGTSSNTVPWDPAGGPGFDAEVLSLYRAYARWHLRLFPYLWSLAARLADDGRPLARPFGLMHPELGVHPNDQYFLGDSLLVAPVLARGRTTRTVQFPAGLWVDFWSGETVAGGSARDVAAPLETLPLFLPQGAIVPLLRSTIDTLSPTADPTRVDSFATRAGPLVVRVVPGEASSFVLYDGARIEQAMTDDGLRVTFTPGTSFDGSTLFEIQGFPSPEQKVVTVDGVLATSAATVDEPSIAGGTPVFAVQASTRQLRIGVGPGAHVVLVTGPLSRLPPGARVGTMSALRDRRWRPFHRTDWLSF